MGDNFLKQQVRNFRKGRDNALDKLSEPTLFATPETMGKSYPVFEVNGQTVTPQDTLLAVPSKTPGRIELVRGTCHGKRTSNTWETKELRQVPSVPSCSLAFDFQRPFAGIPTQLAIRPTDSGMWRSRLR